VSLVKNFLSLSGDFPLETRMGHLVKKRAGIITGSSQVHFFEWSGDYSA
jgi:hypothetical protein